MTNQWSNDELFRLRLALRPSSFVPRHYFLPANNAPLPRQRSADHFADRKIECSTSTSRPIAALRWFPAWLCRNNEPNLSLSPVAARLCPSVCNPPVAAGPL